MAKKPFPILWLVHAVLLLALWPLAASAQVKPNWKEVWEKTLSQAKKEGKVVVFGPPGDLIRKAMMEDFGKAFPDIQIEYSGGAGNELATRVRSERDAGIHSIDVVLSGTTTANVYFKPMKALEPLEPALILPEVADPKYWKEGIIEYSDEASRMNLVFVNLTLPPINYDPKQVKPEEVDQLYDFLQPKWKGKIVINDPVPSGPANVYFRWLWRILGPDKAADYYRKIRDQAAVVDRDQRRQIEWVAQGKYAILLAPNTSIGQQLLLRGLQFGVLGEFRDYGGLVTAAFGSAMLLAPAPHPNAAKVFLNWVLGKEGQISWSKAMNHVSRRVDVPTDHLPSYLLPKPGAKYWSTDYKPGYRYWLSHSEANVHRPPEEEKTIKELFGR